MNGGGDLELVVHGGWRTWLRLAWWVLTVEEGDARSLTEDCEGSWRDGAQPKRETARVCNRERGKRRRWGRLWVKGEDGS